MSGPSNNREAVHPALLQPPFYTIPGISPSTPIPAQLEQVDQLNTLLLQEIDANFARFHQIVTTKILPEIKRFALSQGPTRDAAEFWRSFYENAAGVSTDAGREDESQSALGASPNHTMYDDHTLTLRRDEDESSLLFDRTPDQESLMFDPPGISSTPIPSRSVGPNESWEASMESPFDRVDRQLGVLRMDDSSDMPTPSLPSGYSLPPLDSNEYSTGTVDPADLPSTQISRQSKPSREKERDREREEERRDTRRGSSGASTPRPNTSRLPVPSTSGYSSPRPTPRLIDLANTPLNAKIAKKKPSGALVFDDDLDDDLDFGMSPPVTMNFGKIPTALPPRAQAIMSSGTPVKSYSRVSSDKTLASVSSTLSSAPSVPSVPSSYSSTSSSIPPPLSSAFSTTTTTAGSNDQKESSSAIAAREQAREISNLLDEISKDYDENYEPSPRMPTPEGLGRYSILPSDLGPGRRLFDPAGSGSGSGSGSGTASRGDRGDRERSERGDGSDRTALGLGQAHQPPSRGPPSTRKSPRDSLGALGLGRRPRRSVANTSYGSDIQTTEDGPGALIGDDESFDSVDSVGDDTFSDASYGYGHGSGSGMGMGALSAATAAAEGGFEFVDESYVSDVDGDVSAYYAGGYGQSGGGGGGGAGAGGYGSGAGSGYGGAGYGRGDYGGGDRYDADGFTDTHVGAAAHDASEVFGRPGAGPRPGQFALHQQDEMVTYHGGRLEDALMPHSPTRARQ